MFIREFIKRLLKVNGVIIKRHPEMDVKRRMQLINQKNINSIIDVGANIGQYATLMREYGYKGKILSFEPLLDAHEKLSKSAGNDPLWEAYNYALGDKNEKAFINVAGNSFSSSILDMLDITHENAPELKYVDKQEITIKKLDEIFEELCDTKSSTMLKIDVQGFEKEVLEGARESLRHIDIIQLEMAVIPLYKDEMTLCDMITYLKGLNFELFSLENGYFDSTTGQLLQVDGIFWKVS